MCVAVALTLPNLVLHRLDDFLRRRIDRTVSWYQLLVPLTGSVFLAKMKACGNTGYSMVRGVEVGRGRMNEQRGEEKRVERKRVDDRQLDDWRVEKR